MRVYWLSLAAVLASCATPNLSNSASQARTVIDRVFHTFNTCNVEALVANYSDDNLEFFTPGTPRPLSSRAELHKYFSYLDAKPCANSESAKHTNVTLKVRPLGPEAAIVHATTVVKYEDKGEAISFPFYFTFVLQQQGGQWFVVSQNAQPVPKN